MVPLAGVSGTMSSLQRQREPAGSRRDSLCLAIDTSGLWTSEALNDGPERDAPDVAVALMPISSYELGSDFDKCLSGQHGASILYRARL